jgi:hypothetical protein
MYSFSTLLQLTVGWRRACELLSTGVRAKGSSPPPYFMLMIRQELLPGIRVEHEYIHDPATACHTRSKGFNTSYNPSPLAPGGRGEHGVESHCCFSSNCFSLSAILRYCSCLARQTPWAMALGLGQLTRLMWSPSQISWG